MKKIQKNFAGETYKTYTNLLYGVRLVISKVKINSADNINSEIKKSNKLPGDILTTNIKNNI